MHGQCKEDVLPQRSGSLVNLGNDDNRTRVGLAKGNWRISGSNFEVENSQENRQEKVYLAHRKLEKTKAGAKSEEENSSTRKLLMHHYQNLEHEILKSSTHGKDLPMHTEEIGKVCNRCYVLNGIRQEQGIDMDNVHDIVDEGSHLSWARFLGKFGNRSEHRIRKHRECVEHHS